MSSAQAQAKAEVAREAGKARSELSAAHTERTEALAALQARLDEQMDARATAESRLRQAQSEAQRLNKVESKASALDDKCRQLQSELDKKKEMLERVYKRRSMAAPMAPPPPPPPPPPQMTPSAYTMPSTTAPSPKLPSPNGGAVHEPSPNKISGSELLSRSPRLSSSSLGAAVPMKALPLSSSSGNNTVVAFSDGAAEPTAPAAKTTSGGLSTRSMSAANARQPSPRWGEPAGGVKAGVKATAAVAGGENGGRVSTGRPGVKHVQSRFLSPKVRNV